MHLPLLLRRRSGSLWYLLYWAPYIALYQLSNRFLLVAPRELALTTLDRSIPFLPELLPLYVAYIPFFWWTVASARDDAELNRIFYATHFQLLICLPLFVLFPVCMPRDLFYGALAYNWADVFWRWFDAPNNCLPSLHAANCLLLARMYRDRLWRLASDASARGPNAAAGHGAHVGDEPFGAIGLDTAARWAARVHTTIAFAIVASTVLVKQHYTIDLVAGAFVYLAAMAFLDRLELTAPVVPSLASDGAAPRRV